MPHMQTKKDVSRPYLISKVSPNTQLSNKVKPTLERGRKLYFLRVSKLAILENYKVKSLALIMSIIQGIRNGIPMQI